METWTDAWNLFFVPANKRHCPLQCPLSWHKDLAKAKAAISNALLTLRMSSRGHWSRRYLCKSRHNTVQSRHSTGDIKDLLGSIVSTGPFLQQRFLKHHCLRTNHMTLSNRKSLNRPLCHPTSKPSIHTGRLGEGQATIRSSSLTEGL